MEKIKRIILKLTKIATLAFFPLVLLFLGAFITMWIAIRGSEVKVPYVVGMDQSRAQQVIMGAHLTAYIGGKRFSKEIAMNHVLKQYPKAGTLVKEHRKITLILSEGQPKIVVPKVVGLTLKEADVVLRQSGLNVGLVSRAHLLESTREVIVEQFPPPQSTQLQIPYVNLLVSIPSIEETYVMPDLMGFNSEDVKFFFEKNGFVVRPFQYESDFFNPSGIILSHYPEAGYPVGRTTPITLVVSK